MKQLGLSISLISVLYMVVLWAYYRGAIWVRFLRHKVTCVINWLSDVSMAVEQCKQTLVRQPEHHMANC